MQPVSPLALLADELAAETAFEVHQRRRWKERLASVATADNAQLTALLDRLLALPPWTNEAPAALLQKALEALARQRDKRNRESAPLDNRLREQVAQLYAYWRAQPALRESLLSLLAHARTSEDLRLLAELVVEDPPETTLGPAQAFAPLVQHRDYRLDDLFPRLLDGLSQPTVAVPILDLANFSARERGASPHPAAEKKELLMSLLGAIASRLAVLEERLTAPQDSLETTIQQVADGVSLGVGLCDALGLIGDQQAIGKLYQTLDLRHRRLQCEAAAALVRLGDDTGRVRLAALAAEPAARLRVLAYADELQMADQIDPQYATPAAIAEAELAIALAEPTLLGAPPTSLELVDQREQYWPGFEEALDCFLFRFHYDLGAARYTNIGISGPLAFAVGADLGELSYEDIYALFAGWQAEHADMYEIPADKVSDRRLLETLTRRLLEAGCEEIRPEFLGMFFGEPVLAAHASREGTPGIAVIDQEKLDWRPLSAGPRPLGPREVYSIYKGRKLLQSFNG
ncbi:HEAT repeat domain-containing protein [Lignipirellula cremea]|uniref:HEAT repeat protein n=1 Tax=Lignipirellula cremea TaxID=2528010 RepID=A0A518E0C9_9BACT|nr:HEAT repeat domain-containing protein [Lignipirellula cremea]QDU97556.1 hypothetical protein Pla8534_54040 [Lignipirellula cremea]